MISFNYQVPHPGTFILEELDARGWFQRDLAFVLDCPEASLNTIISGKRGISPDMAKLLGNAFDVPAEFFLNLQKTYELSNAKEPDPAVSLRAKLLGHFPVREMIKRGWLDQTDAYMLEAQLARFFKMQSAEDIPHLRHAAKKTHYDDIPAAQLAWLFRVKQIAETMVMCPYSEHRLRASINDLSRLLIEPEEVRHVPRILAECGIRFVIVEALPKSEIDGVVFWLDKKSPVIGMSLCRDRIDNFWFVLRHEIEHVLQKHGQQEECLDMNITGDDSNNAINISEEEGIANKEAANFCVSKDEIDDFIARITPFFSEQRILLFSKRIKVHPGIVIGQIHARTRNYKLLRKHLAKIRHLVTQSAMTDGWGQSIEIVL